MEAKAARHGTPKRLYESMSAFANRSTGDVILFGLDESSDFSIVGVGNAHKLEEDITHMPYELMETTLRPEFMVDEVEDETVVVELKRKNLRITCLVLRDDRVFNQEGLSCVSI